MAAFAQAQFIPEPVSLVASPLSPSPGEAVTVTASTPTFDRNSAFFSWTVNSKQRLEFSGQGKNEIQLTAGEIGSVLQVRVEVDGPQGMGGTASVALRVTDLALTWSAETYIPKWYQGKALPTPGAVVNIVAIPRFVVGGREIPPQSLVYRWGLDDEERALTGVGAQVFQIRTSDLPKTSHQIKVTIEDSTRQITKEGEMFIIPTNPRLAIYPSTPLGGIEFRSSPLFLPTTARGIIDFQAEPFFFAIKSRKELPYQWSIGGSEGKGNSGEEYKLSLNTGDSPVPVLPVSINVNLVNSVLSAVSKTLTLFLQ